MERSRGGGSRGFHGWTWKRAALFIGAVGWYTSLAGQILWNLGGALTIEGDERVDGLRDDFSPSIPTCLAQSRISGRVTFGCSQQLAALAGPALGLGALSVWWNPRFKEKLDRGSGSIIGLTEYYKIQCIFLVLRFGSYLALARSPLYDLDAGTRRAMHSFLVVFALIVCIHELFAYQTNFWVQFAVISFRSVKLDLAPRLLFNDGLALLTQQSQDLPQDDQHTRAPGRQQSETPKARSAVQPRPFPLNDLAPNQGRSQPPSYNPPTPPPEEDGLDEMDWTPSQQPFQPAPPKPQLAIPTIAQPSPFYGRLPPAPLSQAHKLRNPPNQPTFRQATAAQKQSFFNNRRRSHLDRDNISEASTEYFDSPVKTVLQSEAASPRFAEPRFFPQSDYERDTGLESIFSNVFSIEEEPHELRVAREQQLGEEQEQRSANQRQQAHHSTGSKNLQAASFLILALSFLAWIFASSISFITIPIQLTCLAVAAIIAGRGLFETIRNNKIYWKWSDMFIYILELCSSLFLGKATSKTSPLIKHNGRDIYGNELQIAGIALLGIMFLQEFWIWISISKFRRQPIAISHSASTEPSNPSSSLPVIITNSAMTTTTTTITTKNKPRNDESLPLSLSLSPKKKNQNDKHQHQQQQRQPQPNSSAPPVSFSSSDRITRSKSKRESIGTATMNGLGNLSLGGDGGGLGGGMGAGMGAGLGGGMRSRRR